MHDNGDSYDVEYIVEIFCIINHTCNSVTTLWRSYFRAFVKQLMTILQLMIEDMFQTIGKLDKGVIVYDLLRQ